MWKKFIWLWLIMFGTIASATANPPKITVGMAADYPPFEFKRGEEIIGFDVELAKAIADEMGAELVIKDMAFAILFNALSSGEIDMIISSATVSEEKKLKFDFSEPYFFDTVALLHQAGQKIDAKDLSGKSIACQLGASAMHNWFKVQYPKAKIVLMDVMTQMAESIKAGHVDGAIMDKTQVKEFVKNSKGLTYQILGSPVDGIAVVMQKGSKLVEPVNAIIANLKKSGQLKAWQQKWIEGDTQTVKRSVINDFLFIAKGLPTTLLYSFLALVLGGLLGTGFAVARYLNHGNFVVTGTITGLISVIRGTPVLLQLGFIYFALPTLLGIKLSVLAAGVITFAINSAAYITEILRSGLQSLPKGQFEACQALGISKWHTWFGIILPQVLRNVFPSLINEVVTLTKETALISVLGEMDVLRRAQAMAAETYNYFEPMGLAAIVYYLLVKAIEFIGKRLEQRWHHA